MSFRLGSIPVRVRPEFFILPAYFALRSGLEKGVLWAAIVFVSVLWHELGHAMAMRACGFAPRIELHGMGGWTLWPEDARPNDKQALLVALAGPGIELLAGLAVLLALGSVELPPLAEWARMQFIWVNLLWALVNLAPILPWDGGLALDSVVNMVTGRRRTRGVGMISMLCGVAVMLAVVQLDASILLLYIGGLGVWEGWKRWRRHEPGKAPAEADTAWELLRQGQLEQAEALLATALAATKDVRARARWHGSRALRASKTGPQWRPRSSSTPVRSTPRECSASERSRLAASRCLRSTPRAACAGSAGADEGLDWLTQAVKAGYKTARSLEEDPDLTPLRAHPDFAALNTAAMNATPSTGR